MELVWEDSSDDPSAKADDLEMLGRDPGTMDDGLSVLEPEAEDEADGWEIVQPHAAKPARSLTSPRDQAAVGDRAPSLADEVPEDLVMGCLSPECEAQFGEGCERRRCGFCQLHFCERHVSSWTLLWCQPPSAEDGSDGHRGISSAAQASRALFETLGIRTRLGTVGLCCDCHAALAFAPSAALMLGPPPASVLDPVGLAPAAPSRVATPSLPRGTDVGLLATEAQVMRAMSLRGLMTPSVAEDPSRPVVRGLLLRLLGRLRVCLRPWLGHERKWVWPLREELVEEDPSWIAQFARQANWDIATQAQDVALLIERANAQQRLGPHEALQVLGTLRRHAPAAAATIGERRLGVVATHAAEALLALDKAELACCLELLLDAGGELSAAGARSGRQAVVNVLIQAACDDAHAAVALRGELFWALEARAKAAVAAKRLVPPASMSYTRGAAPPADQWSWAGVALEELLQQLPAEAELGLLRQRAWVRQAEHGEFDAARLEPAWGEPRAFPLAVWPPGRHCLGLEGQPHQAASRSTPVILRCRCRGPGAPDAAQGPATAGLLLKRDPDMPCEQQVGQTLRLLELLIWEDSGLRELLAREGLGLEDVRVTYVIAMTGAESAMLEAVEGAHTLRSVRTGRRGTALHGRLLAPPDQGGLLGFLRQHNRSRDLPRALLRLAFTAAVSAVLSFVAGLGDRHHENFMATTDGRLLHVDYGYAFGREPLDSVLIHYAVQGGRPATTLQYRELQEALGHELLERVFWPVVRGAYLRIRRHAGLLAEMVHTALLRRPRWHLRGSPAECEQAWAMALAFVARCCATTVGERSAERFVYKLLRHCAQDERGARLRDELKGLRLRERTQQAVSRACGAALATGRHASAALGHASLEATTAAKGLAAGLLDGVFDLLVETSANMGAAGQGDTGAGRPLAGGPLRNVEEDATWRVFHG